MSHFSPGVFEYGGVATFARNIVEAICEAGYSCELIASAPGFYPQRRRFLCCDVIHIPMGFSAEEIDLASPSLMNVCLYTSADVFIVNDYMSFPCLVTASRRAKTVAYFHTFAASPWDLIAVSYADKLATNSKLMKDLIVNVLGVRSITSGWTAKKATDVEVVYPAPPKVAGVRDPGDKLFDVCYLGRVFQPEKNIYRLIQATKELGLKLAIITHDHFSSSESHVKVFNNVDEEAKARIVSRCAIGVLPSTFEPFGLAALEMVALGVPVALSERSGVAEVLPGPRFNPTDVESMKKAILETLRFRDEVLKQQQKAKIMQRTWKDVLFELLKGVVL